MKFILSLIAATAMFVSASSAKAEQFCAPRDWALIELEKQFEEKVFGRGLAANGQQMIELFVSKSGSWTMLASDPNGLSCIMANGEDWQGLTVLVGDPA